MIRRENLSVKEGLLADLKNDEWTPELMAVAMAAKQTRRAEKPLSPINAFILDRQLQSADEVDYFYTQLVANLPNMPNGARFQLAVRLGEHWTFYDNIITDGKLQIFNLDAAGVDRVYNLNKIFASILPADSRIYIYTSDLLLDKDGKVVLDSQGQKRSRDIQMDHTSCPIYVLDYVSSLSRIDVFSLLKDAAQTTAPTDASQKVLYFELNPDQIPPEMAAIFRTSQSQQVTHSLHEEIKNAPASKQGEILLDYKKTIDDKKTKFKVRIKQFIEKSSDEELEKLMLDRGGVFISDEKDADDIYKKIRSAIQPYIEKYKNASFLNFDRMVNSNYYVTQQKFCDTFVKDFLKYIKEKRYLDAANELNRLVYFQSNIMLNKNNNDFLKKFKNICMGSNNNSNELAKNLMSQLQLSNCSFLNLLDKTELGQCIKNIDAILGDVTQHRYSLRL